jgi:hypothetical protein
MKNSPLLCTVCGVALAACVHGAVFGDDHHVDPNTVVVIPARPPEHDHTHQEYERVVRIALAEAGTASGTAHVLTAETGTYRITGTGHVVAPAPRVRAYGRVVHLDGVA